MSDLSNRLRELMKEYINEPSSKGSDDIRSEFFDVFYENFEAIISAIETRGGIEEPGSMETKLTDAECEARGWKKLAVIDCGEVSLYWGNADGDSMQDILPPPDWPEFLTDEFLAGKGFEVEL